MGLLIKKKKKQKIKLCAFVMFTGSGWMFYFVIFIQTAINTGVGIGAILLAGQCIQVYIYLLPLYIFLVLISLHFLSHEVM